MPYHQLADLDVLAKATVRYVTLPGWETAITECQTFEELPENCQGYIRYIEKELGVPIEWIGTGPGRQSMISRLSL